MKNYWIRLAPKEPKNGDFVDFELIEVEPDKFIPQKGEEKLRCAPRAVLNTILELDSLKQNMYLSSWKTFVNSKNHLLENGYWGIGLYEITVHPYSKIRLLSD